MKNISLFAKAFIFTPIAIATAWLLFILSYLSIPLLVLFGIFALLKAEEDMKNDEDND
jgi:Ulp1 family protease